MDDFKAFRDDIIEKILIDEEIAIRSRLKRQYKYQKKSAKFITTECRDKLYSVREGLDETPTFELLVKAIEIVSKDLVEQNNATVSHLLTVASQ